MIQRVKIFEFCTLPLAFQHAVDVVVISGATGLEFQVPNPQESNQAECGWPLLQAR
jgi:hypothetical protein